MNKTVLIIGAGPAGLAAAYQLSQNDNYQVIIAETASKVGGLAKTLEFSGNKIDIGPHRFFSKNPRVNEFWTKILAMTKIPRLTRIYYNKNFFIYPISFNWQTIKNLGIKKILLTIISYLKIRLHPIRPEKNLEDFFINRFGRFLYIMFFKDYTEKIWGRRCQEISAQWGAQRIKGLSIISLLKNFLPKKILKNKKILKRV